MSEVTDRQENKRPWLRHYPLQVSPTYEYPKTNIANILLDSAREYPNHEALDFLGRSYTYKELLRQCRKLANALRTFGVSKGDRVAIMLPNCPQAVIAYYGGLMAGAVIVQTNPIYTERELHDQLADCGATTLITLDLLMPRVDKARENTALRQVIVTSLSDALPFPKNVLYPIKRRKEYPDLHVKYKKAEGIVRWSAVLRKGKETPICEEVNADTELAMIQYTGGTTGRPKGVMLTHANLLANTVQAATWCYRMEKGKERYLAALPLFHVFGLTVLLNQAIYQGGSILLVPRFDPRMVLETIRRRKPTVFPGAPTMYIALLNHPHAMEGDLSSVRVCVSGAAPLPREVQEKFEKKSGGKLIEGYGLTEASPVTHCNPIWSYRKAGTIGIPLPDTDVRIVGEDSLDPLPAGEIGELAIKGPQVMAGYWNRPEETASAIRDGWLRTGDLAKMDEEGFFSIIDRKKDIILAGGFNVYPREVEEILFEHPAVKEASVLGVPDSYRGETVKAYIVLKEGWQVSEMQLNRWCRERLAPYKVPKLYEFRDSLPLSLIGKVIRRKLKEELEGKEEE
ncbi:long-chain-fatty-acid--CoA ligase [Cohnella cholangitidis]|uniref:Long-chain fatty acid--CoA ligase n=1 Tax=Cohnella cholangitidis TaxID=2598458 RepID=A0A7G5C1A8_9BACL|nr:long-chain fatty acid--CoA ligase [Cohnella cholangitidis]QMV42992.1 long-chain fatty acid--CoA ligase [Cohnella cholangitidis]